MKKLITLLVFILTGCDTNSKQYETEYEDIFAGDKRYKIVCIDGVQYLQANNGSLSPKYKRGNYTPTSCENKPEVSK